MLGLGGLIGSAKNQGNLKKVTIIDHEIPTNPALHAMREAEEKKRIAELNVTEIVEVRTATTRKYRPIKII